MTLQTHNFADRLCDLETLLTCTDQAVRAIPPAWPLASNVAVNPYLGQAHESLASVSARLSRVAGVPVTMPRAYYQSQIDAGKITIQDLDAALLANNTLATGLTHDMLRDAAKLAPANVQAIPTIADLAGKVSGVDWRGLFAERFGLWCGSWIDQGQALWAASKGANAYAAWRDVAIHDLTPEIAGLTGFASTIAATSTNAAMALSDAAQDLCVAPSAMPTYFHALLMDLGGWAQVARYRLWQAELGEQTDSALSDFLTIRILWEAALFAHFRPEIESMWQDAMAAHAKLIEPNQDQIIDQLLQEASEHAGQRALATTLQELDAPQVNTRPPLQAAFCIDVRSEVFRRALESVNPNIQTFGFAGFFGLTASHKRFASDETELRLPVLLNPGVYSCSGDASHAHADQTARLSARASRAWGRFKLAAVSSFAFVEASGPLYVAKLLRDGLGLKTVKPPNDPAPRLDPALDLPAQIGAANTILRAMSLTGPFARVIILAGHGASVVNNPFASALQCGACGGYSGEVNARLVAGLLNDPHVRAGVKVLGIDIPSDTLFLAGLHDTTNDSLKIYDTDHNVSAHKADLQAAGSWFAAAGKLTRTQRALQLPSCQDESLIGERCTDWAQVRPEWALAGCKAFIAAPRARTKGKNLEGRAFLHDYDHNQDIGFGILELIMTAPVVVASWISLQYYGSSVAPDFFGSGNKLLHNVVGGVGVVEGNGGVLRTGLPLQSVHDGERLVHEPVRLSVCIEAPLEAITDVLARHQGVRDLFDNKWLYLFALDNKGHIAHRYDGGLTWTPWEA